MNRYKGLTKAELIGLLEVKDLKEADNKIEIAKMKKSHEESVKKYKGFIQDHNKLIDDYDKLTGENQDLLTANIELDEALTKANSMISFRTQEVNETKHLKERITSLDKTLGEVQETRDKLEERLQERQAKVRSQNVFINELEDLLKEKETTISKNHQKLSEQAPRIKKLNQIEKQREVMSKITITFLVMIALTTFFTALGWLCEFAFGLLVGGHAVTGTLLSIVLITGTYWVSSKITKIVIGEDD